MVTRSRAASCRTERAGFIVGLTGGIGSGKTTVSDHLATLGAAIVDTDLIAHDLTGAGGDAMPAIAEQFGMEFVTAEGALDRGRMRALVFAQPAAKTRLESILHPLIRNATTRQAQLAAGNAPYLVLVIPLLVESGGWRERAHRMLLVDCSVATQTERVQRRSNLDADALAAIIGQQASRRQRLDAADDIIVNEGEATALAARVARLHAFYLRLAGAGSLEGL